ncbi:2-hydroxy-3-keto-5-methylthiopentenyl-1-phosphate phosphatase [Aeribacillus alveayuensis]|uniref:2-hydroxy-3-keto-5-methylthiopentenyl-1-phosphate phosphatase n=1 Tax=Aeribacillus alveayuensis TaxID=279215 RepID=A0ABT9VMQ9_9BACI|nr:2-hydroxy-3-keto-5-methylthiopentenyl-1-phosphate phosphatase [Bacillus alveayuensis]
MKKPLIICDFDGTITKKDNIISIMKKFASPEWESVKDAVLDEEMSIRKGVGKMFSFIPSYQKYAMIEYILSTAEIREGFKQFVEYTERENIPLFIVSGGIDFFVKPLLKHLIAEDRIFCNEADFSHDFVEIQWPHSCDDQCSNDCGCCKPSIIRKIQSKDNFVIVIGDSITDLEAAKLADFVFARDLLLKKCQDLNLPHRSFETFTDIITYLQHLNEMMKASV